MPLTQGMLVQPVPSSYINYTWDTDDNIEKCLKQEYLDERRTRQTLEQVCLLHLCVEKNLILNHIIFQLFQLIIMHVIPVELTVKF